MKLSRFACDFTMLGQLDHGRRIVDVSLLRDVRKGDVMIDEEDQRAALLGRELQTRRHALGKKRARFGMGPRANAFAGVVQEEGEIEDIGIGQLLEQVPGRAAAWVLSSRPSASSFSMQTRVCSSAV